MQVFLSMFDDADRLSCPMSVCPGPQVCNKPGEVGLLLSMGKTEFAASASSLAALTAPLSGKRRTQGVSQAGVAVQSGVM